MTTDTLPTWRRLDDYCWEWNGYRVALARVRGDEKFAAFTPALSDRDYEEQKRVRYEVGMPAPQPRELIGIFTEIELARLACAGHYRRNNS